MSPETEQSTALAATKAEANRLIDEVVPPHLQSIFRGFTEKLTQPMSDISEQLRQGVEAYDSNVSAIINKVTAQLRGEYEGDLQNDAMFALASKDGKSFDGIDSVVEELLARQKKPETKDEKKEKHRESKAGRGKGKSARPEQSLEPVAELSQRITPTVDIPSKTVARAKNASVAAQTNRTENPEEPEPTASQQPTRRQVVERILRERVAEGRPAVLLALDALLRQTPEQVQDQLEKLTDRVDQPASPTEFKEAQPGPTIPVLDLDQHETVQVKTKPSSEINDTMPISNAEDETLSSNDTPETSELALRYQALEEFTETATLSDDSDPVRLQIELSHDMEVAEQAEPEIRTDIRELILATPAEERVALVAPPEREATTALVLAESLTNERFMRLAAPEEIEETALILIEENDTASLYRLEGSPETETHLIVIPPLEPPAERLLRSDDPNPPFERLVAGNLEEPVEPLALPEANPEDETALETPHGQELPSQLHRLTHGQPGDLDRDPDYFELGPAVPTERNRALPDRGDGSDFEAAPKDPPANGRRRLFADPGVSADRSGEPSPPQPARIEAALAIADVPLNENEMSTSDDPLELESGEVVAFPELSTALPLPRFEQAAIIESNGRLFDAA